MHERPMKGLLDALRKFDAADFVFHKKEDHFPSKCTKGILSPRAMVDASASSQIRPNCFNLTCKIALKTFI